MPNSIPFVHKVDKPSEEKNHSEVNHSTPLDVKKFPKEPEKSSHEKKDMKSNSHVATVVQNRINIPKVDKYIFITILSGLFFLSSVIFWIYVQFMMP